MKKKWKKLHFIIHLIKFVCPRDLIENGAVAVETCNCWIRHRTSQKRGKKGKQRRPSNQTQYNHIVVFLHLALMPLLSQKEFLIQNGNKRGQQNETFTDLGWDWAYRLQGFEATLCQQEHPRAWVWDCDALPLDDFRFTSTMSSCFAEESVSIPGKAAAIFRNSACTKKVHVTKEFHDQDNYNLVSIQ